MPKMIVWIIVENHITQHIFMLGDIFFIKICKISGFFIHIYLRGNR